MGETCLKIDDTIQLLKGNSEALIILRDKMKKTGNYPKALEITELLGEEPSSQLLEKCGEWYINLSNYLEDYQLEMAKNYIMKAGTASGFKIIGKYYDQQKNMPEAVEWYQKANENPKSLDTKLNLVKNSFEQAAELYESIGLNDKASYCRRINELYLKLDDFSLLIKEKEELGTLLKEIPNSKDKLMSLTKSRLDKYWPFNEEVPLPVKPAIIVNSSLLWFNYSLIDYALRFPEETIFNNPITALISVGVIAVILTVLINSTVFNDNYFNLKRKKEIKRVEPKAPQINKRLLGFKDYLNTL